MRRVDDGKRAASARRVRAVRAGLGMSVEAFARLLDVTVGAIRQWERGARVPSEAVQEKLSEVRLP